MGLFDKIKSFFKKESLVRVETPHPQSPINPLEIWYSEEISLKRRVERLYKTILSEAPVRNLSRTLEELERITDIVPLKNMGLRKDLITLESLVRARIEYEEGTRFNASSWCKGNPRIADSYLDYHSSPTFLNFVRYDRIKNAKTMGREFWAPFVTEAGTFHYSSLTKYGVIENEDNKK